MIQQRSLAVLGTIQYSHAVHAVARKCRERLSDCGWTVTVDQVAPLTPGEVLGCTSPLLEQSCRICVFIADGRFHLESAMIQNPQVTFYRYDPMTKVCSRDEVAGHCPWVTNLAEYFL